MQAGEDTPLHSAHLYALIRVASEAGRAFGRHGGLQIVASLEIIVRLGVVGQRVPLVVRPAGSRIQQRGRDKRGLVVARVVTHLGVQLIAVPLHAETAAQRNGMCGIPLVPFQTRVAHDGILLGKQRTRLILAEGSEARHIVVGDTVQRDIIFLVRVGQHVTEVFAERKMCIELESGLDGKAQHGVLEIVFVLRLAVFQYGQRITQLPVVIVVSGQGFVKVCLVRHVQMVFVNLPSGEGIRTKHGSLGVCQERRRRGCPFLIARGSRIVTQVAGNIGKRRVETYVQLAAQRNIGIEPDVQTVHIILFQCGLCSRISQRQVILCHFIPAFHVDAVILQESRAVHLFFPVRVFVVFLRIVV